METVYSLSDFITNPKLFELFNSRDLISIRCRQCLKTCSLKKHDIQTKIGRGRKDNFCSSKCNSMFKNKDKITYHNCTNCDKPVRRTPSTIEPSGKVYCSRSCSAKVNNQGQRRHPPRECINCSTDYVTTKTHKSLKYCSECVPKILTRDEAKLLNIHEILSKTSIKDKHISWKFSYVRILNRSWNKELTKLPCQFCSYSAHVELCHIKPVSSFPETAMVGEINDPSNILVLCRNHHWEFDHGLLKLEDIPPRK